MKWLHRLFNPHCQHCIDEIQFAKECNSCEVLKHELELMRIERDRLLSKLLDKPEVVEREVNDKEPVPINPKYVPTAVRRNMLEIEDRIRARKLAEAPKPVEAIEKDLGITKEVNG